jgi:hypothetical protein
VLSHKSWALPYRAVDPTAMDFKHYFQNALQQLSMQSQQVSTPLQRPASTDTISFLLGWPASCTTYQTPESQS